jgi:hypothetical protein
MMTLAMLNALAFTIAAFPPGVQSSLPEKRVVVRPRNVDYKQSHGGF